MEVLPAMALYSSHRPSSIIAEIAVWEIAALLCCSVQLGSVVAELVLDLVLDVAASPHSVSEARHAIAQTASVVTHNMPIRQKHHIRLSILVLLED